MYTLNQITPILDFVVYTKTFYFKALVLWTAELSNVIVCRNRSIESNLKHLEKVWQKLLVTISFLNAFCIDKNRCLVIYSYRKYEAFCVICCMISVYAIIKITC